MIGICKREREWVSEREREGERERERDKNGNDGNWNMRCNHFLPYSLSYIFLPVFHSSLFSLSLSLFLFRSFTPSFLSRCEGERKRVRRGRRRRRGRGRGRRRRGKKRRGTRRKERTIEIKKKRKWRKNYHIFRVYGNPSTILSSFSLVEQREWEGKIERNRGKGWEKEREKLREWEWEGEKKEKRGENNLLFPSNQIHFHPNYRLISSLTHSLSPVLSLTHSPSLIFGRGEEETC